jgi:hypothetical protein
MNNIEALIEKIAQLPRDQCRSVVFAKHEGVIVPKHEHPYFKRKIPDGSFDIYGYTDVVGGRYNPRFNAREWTRELGVTFFIHKVETAVMYFRPELPSILDIRILIKSDEFYKRVR